MLCSSLLALAAVLAPPRQDLPLVITDVTLISMERDVAHAARVAGVCVRGRWLSRADLDGMLDELAAKNKGGSEDD